MFRETRKSSSPPQDKMTFHGVCKFVATCCGCKRAGRLYFGRFRDLCFRRGFWMTFLVTKVAASAAVDAAIAAKMFRGGCMAVVAKWKSGMEKWIDPLRVPLLCLEWWKFSTF